MTHNHTWQHAGFVELWSPLFFLFLILISSLYLAITGPWRGYFHIVESVTSKQKILFCVGILWFYIALGSPLDYYGHHYIFSAHMLQQAICYFVLPPFILRGIPDYVYRKAFEYRWVRRIVITHPIFATVFFNGIFSFYHYPIVFNSIMENMLLMMLSHAILFVSAFQMWWHIAAPSGEFTRVLGLRKIGYIFLSGMLLTPACGLIIFAGSPVYMVYANAPQILFPALDDQQLGGTVMKIIQEICYGVALTFGFFEWYRKENPIDTHNPQVDGEWNETLTHSLNDPLIFEPTVVGPQNRL
ncbi:MAG TPA: cytochrome c oxidase assembly protein [Bacillota bacterium]|nr:cytochrome c oxidase assembly protein [Bacillota bacterium]